MKVLEHQVCDSKACPLSTEAVVLTTLYMHADEVKTVISSCTGGLVCSIMPVSLPYFLLVIFSVVTGWAS